MLQLRIYGPTIEYILGDAWKFFYVLITTVARAAVAAFPVNVIYGGFVDVEGTKDVKRLINLLAITVNLYHEIDADPSGSGS